MDLISKGGPVMMNLQSTFLSYGRKLESEVKFLKASGGKVAGAAAKANALGANNPDTKN
jgi:hypothetical protein